MALNLAKSQDFTLGARETAISFFEELPLEYSKLDQEILQSIITTLV